MASERLAEMKAATVGLATAPELLRDRAARLRALRKGLERADEAELLKLLVQLASVDITADALRETAIGREVNDKFLREHASAAIRERSTELVSSWKASVTAASASRPPSSCAATALPAAAAVTCPAAERNSNREEEQEKEKDEQRIPKEDAKAEEKETETRKQKEKEKGKKEKAEKKEKREKQDGKEKEKQGKREERVDGKKRFAEGAADGSHARAKIAAADRDATASSPGPNEALAELFSELASFEFKRNEKFKGIAYKRVAANLKAHPEKVSSGKEASLLPGVGKESVKKIDEFLSTGKVERLEKYRRGDLAD